MNRLDPLEIALQGTSLIEASAGTGKTFTIATLYLRLLLERELAVSEILVVTYTRAATAELRDRIRTRIARAIHTFETGETKGDAAMDGLLLRIDGEDGRQRAIRQLSAALAGFDEAAILTIHGFCQRVLRENAFECGAGFDVKLLADQNALLLEIVGDYWSRSIAREPKVFVRYLINHRTSVQSLLQLVQRAGAAEPFALIPESQPVAEEHFERLEAAWARAFQELLNSWEKSRTDVISQLHAAASGGDLNKSSYKPAAILAGWAHEMDQALTDSSPTTARRFEVFKRFTPETLAHRTNKGKTTPEHPFFDACGRLAEVYEELYEVLHAHKINFERGLIATVESESRARKERKGQQSYDDLLLRVARALGGAGGRLLASRLRSQYRAALVDEFQDTDRLQYQILRSIWHRDDPGPSGAELSSPALFLIGDPKQAIYAFRGADVYAYLMAKDDAGHRCFTLDTNWRSDPSMIKAVNLLFKRSTSPFRLEGIPFEEIAPRSDARDQLDGSQKRQGNVAALDILFMSRTDEKPLNKTGVLTELPWRVAADIADAVRGDLRIAGCRVRPDDVAVLCRTNEQTEIMCRALRSIGIPAAILGSASVFDSDEAREIERLLAAVADPAAAGRVRAALSTRIFGVTGEGLDALARNEEAWDHRLLQFRRWHKDWVERGFMHMFHQLFREARVHVRLLGLEDGERRLTNFLHLAELLEQAVAADHLGPSGLVDWLGRLRGDRSLRGNAIGDAGELRLESDGNAVKVVTVHKSKGLEYPIVYCPFLWEGTQPHRNERRWVRFHDAARENQIVLDLGSDQLSEHQAVADAEARAEAVRFLYVAITRAKHRCSFVWGNVSGTALSPLAPLLHPSIEPSGELGDPKPIPFTKMDDDQMLSEIAELVELSHGAIALRELPAQHASREEFVAQPRSLSRTPATRKLSTRWRQSSFSALIASDQYDPSGLPRTREEGLDYDAVSEPSILGQRGQVETEVRLNSFPSGAAAGTLLHSILEHLDFEKSAHEQAGDVVGDTLEASGFEASWRGRLCDALDRIVKTRWGEDRPRLADLPRSKRLDELEFLLPVAGRGEDRPCQRPMTVADLSEVFRRHARSEFQRGYAGRLATLQFEPLAGYLKGYIDLVFEWDGRFYLVDYKSNHLGPSASNYDAEALEAPMSEHHYVLQYHLYTVALDRYLALRLAGYDYDRHFGGVYYLFLRGMDPDHPAGCGVYHDRPTRECIEALTATLSSRVVGVSA